jgi:hypothetical protein
MLGDWEGRTPASLLVESWSRSTDSSFAGVSYVISNNDTVSFERVVIEQRGQELLYIPTVRGQNNGLAVEFKASLQTDEMVLFENPQHDFPQKISYRLVKVDSMVAEISGTKNGKSRTSLFSYRRKSTRI